MFFDDKILYFLHLCIENSLVGAVINIGRHTRYTHISPILSKCVNDEAIMILESTWHVIGTARADCPPYDGLVLQLSYRAVFIHRSLTPYETNSETIFVAYALNM